jgi:hypothetical protein
MERARVGEVRKFEGLSVEQYVTERSNIKTLRIASSQTTIKGFPSVEQGTTATAVLVNNRYQVKVLVAGCRFYRQRSPSLVG